MGGIMISLPARSMCEKSPFGGTLGKSKPSTSFILNTPPSKGVPTAPQVTYQARCWTSLPAGRLFCLCMPSHLDCHRAKVLTWPVILRLNLVQFVLLDFHLHTHVCSARHRQTLVPNPVEYRFCRGRPRQV